MATYTVKSGDTLSHIAVRYGVPLAQIISLNPQISNPNLIFPGQIVNVPGGSAPAPTVTPPRPSDTSTQTGTQPGFSNGNVDFGGAPTTTQAGTGGGVLTVMVEREDGSIVPQPVYIPDAPWRTMMANTQFASKWGLGNPEPLIPVGALEAFKQDIRGLMAMPQERDMILEKLTYIAGGATTEDSQVDITKRPPPPGFAWTIEPSTGNRTLVDVNPADDRDLSDWHYIITNPETGEGQWSFVQSQDSLDPVFDGVPDSVRPWVAVYLDTGDINNVPEGPAREWVKWVVDKTGIMPVDLPFGIGGSGMPPGSGVPTAPQGGTGGAPSGLGPSSIGTPTNGIGTEFVPMVDQLFQGSNFLPVYDDSPGSAGPGQYSATGFAGSLAALQQRGSTIGTSQSAIDANTPAGHFYRTLLAQGLIEVIPTAQYFAQRGIDINAHNQMLQGRGQPAIDPDAVQIRWVGEPLGGGINDNVPGATSMPPRAPSTVPGATSTGDTSTPFVSSGNPTLDAAVRSGSLQPGSAGYRAYENLVRQQQAPVPTPVQPRSGNTTLDAAYDAGQLPEGSAGARAFQNLSQQAAPPRPTSPAPVQQQNITSNAPTDWQKTLDQYRALGYNI